MTYHSVSVGLVRTRLGDRLWQARQVRGPWSQAIWYAKQVIAGEPELRLVHALCDRNKVSIDVGANRGLYSLAALPVSRRVIAIEPQKRFVDHLRRLMPSKVAVLHCAASDRAGDALFDIPSDERHHQEARLADGNQRVAHASLGRHFEKVETRRLDDIVDDPVGFIKIDVEGHELPVLRGAERLIARDRPNFIVEIENRHAPGRVEEAYDWCLSKDYRMCVLGPDGLTRVSSIEHASALATRHYNFVLHPAEKPVIGHPSVAHAFRATFRI
jgi:FkbM family methyltransferase